MSIEVLTDVVGSPETFLDAVVLQDALEYALGDCKPVDIVKIVYETGSRTGDNFFGLIYRIKVHYRYTHTNTHKNASKDNVDVINFIVKCQLNSKPSEFLHASMVFVKEKRYYQEILPRLELLYQGEEKFGAKLYHTVSSPMKSLIFEDLQTVQYFMASREAGLDITHCILVLQKLGKFHAMSMLLQKKHPELISCLHSGLVSETVLEEGGMLINHYAGLIASLEARVRTWAGFETIANKIQKFRQNFRENLLRLIAPQLQDINVICHGDIWVNNVLFKYTDAEKKKPHDAIFVDFQMTLWASLGIDINYFFNTSVQLDILKTQRLRLLRAYYDSLSATLATHREHSQPTKVKIPTFTEVLHEVEKREPFGFFASFAIFPLISLDKQFTDDNSWDNLTDPEFARKKMDLMFTSNKVQQTLKYSLKRFEELGVFE